MLIVELKSDALKERHWKQLTRQLKVNWILSELTLGQVYDVNLLKNESIVKDTILIAQGEMALEEFLKQVRLNPPIRPKICLIIHHPYRFANHGKTMSLISSTIRTNAKSSVVGMICSTRSRNI